MNNSNESCQQSPSNRHSPSPSLALSAGGQGDGGSPQCGKLFSGDRGLPRSTSIQSSQMWPPAVHADSSTHTGQCVISCPDLNRSTKHPWVLMDSTFLSFFFFFDSISAKKLMEAKDNSISTRRLAAPIQPAWFSLSAHHAAEFPRTHRSPVPPQTTVGVSEVVSERVHHTACHAKISGWKREEAKSARVARTTQPL